MRLWLVVIRRIIIVGISAEQNWHKRVLLAMSIAPAAVYCRNVLHHLPDFWKGVALQRIAGLLAPRTAAK